MNRILQQLADKFVVDALANSRLFQGIARKAHELRQTGPAQTVDGLRTAAERARDVSQGRAGSFRDFWEHMKEEILRDVRPPPPAPPAGKR
jgi:hypothetical protein